MEPGCELLWSPEINKCTLNLGDKSNWEDQSKTCTEGISKTRMLKGMIPKNWIKQLPSVWSKYFRKFRDIRKPS